MRSNDGRTPHARTGSQHAKNSSPNYFGFTVDSNADCFFSSAAQHSRTSWSPPSSQERSTTAASPRIVPLDQNPEYEAFRKQSERQAESNRFHLGGFSMNSMAPRQPSPPFAGDVKKSPTSPKAVPPTSPRRKVVPGNNQLSRSPKRLLSSDPSVFPDRPRRNSPASFADNETTTLTNLYSFLDERQARSSLPSTKLNKGLAQSHHRAETLPGNLDSETCNGAPVLVTAQHVVNLLNASSEDILLLDLRVSTQYYRSRIADALNLCIPTTLLKRASFNVQKVAETFKDEEQRSKFENWRNSKYIVVYDADSTQVKDAMACVNTLKKFVNEGWTGASYIIRGGFAEFSTKFPAFISRDPSTRNSSVSSSFSVDSNGPAVAPVVGGCPMPATENAANPFFGNIRQNMDLIGGVGQIEIKHPASLTAEVASDLPAWLRRAVEVKDQGKAVADKFLQIEKREQKRMQEALSGNVTYGSPNPTRQSCVQIAGIEKGSKNRYNNIWPYEHSRVRLQCVPEGSCDYINANHIKAAWSNKRYIATQGPIPATFTDFWNVVWQQNARVIVMLTAEKEGGQIKAHRYWEDKNYGHLQLNFLSEHRASLEPGKIHRHREKPSMGRRRSTNPAPGKIPKDSPSPSADKSYVIVRRFMLSNANHPFERMREITQLQYSSWPDFGAPAHPTHLLGLIEQCDAVVRSTYGGSYASPEPPDGHPVVVHCSAGCGRTGTFCTVDSVIDMLKRQSKGRAVRQGTPMDMDSSSQNGNLFFNSSPVEGKWVDREDQDLIEKTVEDFRLQRLSMVQSLRQFVLCYESILEWLVEQHPGPRTA